MPEGVQRRERQMCACYQKLDASCLKLFFCTAVVTGTTSYNCTLLGNVLKQSEQYRPKNSMLALLAAA